MDPCGEELLFQQGKGLEPPIAADDAIGAAGGAKQDQRVDEAVVPYGVGQFADLAVRACRDPEDVFQIVRGGGFDCVAADPDDGPVRLPLLRRKAVTGGVSNANSAGRKKCSD